MENLHGSIGVTRPKPWNGPQIVGPNGKTKWFHKGNEAKTMERSSKLWDQMQNLHGSIGVSLSLSLLL